MSGTRRRTDERQNETVTIDGRSIRLTNLDKVMYPATGTTKRDVIDYYRAVARALLPHAEDRPVTRKRWVNGVGTKSHPGDVFFQKNLDKSTPEWITRRKIRHRDHTNYYPLARDEAALAWMAQIAALELHVPQWQFGRNGQPRRPDRLIFDLDPGAGAGLGECAEVAKLVRAILGDRGLDAVPVTSGSNGIHVYAPLDGRTNSDGALSLAHEIARELEADHPDLVVSDMKKSVRKGKVLVDWSQNNFSKTTVCPYSLRGRLRPRVAAPRKWHELDSDGFGQLEYRQVLDRLSATGDLFILGSQRPDRLDDYRSKRKKAQTIEPVPDNRPGSSDGRSFVIHEHHASSLHWDFRLEHDGVLVSWALPKGVPTSRKSDHLAVQTEDHPLEYGSFEGTIPGGQYGAGRVTIWDSGDYELEKWRDGEEIVVVLHGRADGGLGGARKFALIHTKHGDKDTKSNWLIHRMSRTSKKSG